MAENVDLIRSAEVVSLFCRLNLNAKKNIPVRSSEMGLLIYVVKSEVPVTPLMAANFFKVTKPMVAAMVSSLTRQGYITKVPSQDDKRSFTLSPCAKTVELVEQTYSEYHKTLESLRVRLGDDDFNSLIVLIEKANTVLCEDKSNRKNTEAG